MSYIDLTITSNPSTPATNHAELFVSSSDKHLRTIDDTGTVLDFGGGTVGSGTSGQNAVYNGTTSITSGATMSMNSTKITSLANGTASTDAAAFGQLHYLQTPVFFTEGTGKSTSSTTFIDTLTVATITPSSTSSKIKISFGGPASNSIALNAFFGIKQAISGGATTDLVSVANTPFLMGGTTAQQMSGTWLASPAANTAITYTIRIAAQTGSDTANFGAAAAGGATTYILLEEVI